jgi:hypothetical protein
MLPNYAAEEVAPDPPNEQPTEPFRDLKPPKILLGHIGTWRLPVRLIQVRKFVVADERIVAVGLLTDDDLSRLGEAFTRLWPVEDCSGFDELLAAIDEAQERIEREHGEPSVNSAE